MRKNFFKKLAFGLAAALVVTAAAPAAGTANAAASPSLNQKAKNLYLNNDAVGKTFDFNIKNKVKGSTYKWTSSDTAVASVNSKNGVVTGKKVGKATITCKITLPTKKTKTLTATVQVKKNATAVAINNVPENNTIGIGEKAYNFNRDITDSDATDKTFWIIDEESNTAGATVKTSNGVVTTTKPGEFKLTAYTYQNKDELAAKNWTATSETVTVKVVPTLKEAKQSTVSKLIATFDTDMKTLVTKDNITLTNSNGVKQVVKEVSFSDDGKEVTVENYVEFVDKEVYKVTFGDKTVEFTASKGDVVSVAVVPKTVQYQSETKFDVQLFDANGVDVTTKEKLADVEFDYDKAYAYITELGSEDNYKIYMYNYDQSVTVKATFHTWKYANNEEIKYESPAVTFNSVKEIKDQASDIQFTLVSSGNPDWDKPNKNLSAEQEYTLYIKAKDKNGDEITAKDFTYESTDMNVLTVNKSSSDVVTVYGVKSGSAYIKATFGDTVKMLDVTIGAKSKVASLNADVTSLTLYGDGTSAFNDKLQVKLTAKNQYGEEVDVPQADISTTHKSGDSSGIVAATPTADGVITFSLTGNGVTTATDGSNSYDITFSEKTIRVSVNVVRVTDTVATKAKFDKSSATINSAVDEKEAVQEVVIGVSLYNKSDQRVGFCDDAAAAATLDVKFGSDYVIKGGIAQTQDKTVASAAFDETTGVLTFKAGAEATDVLTSAKKGTYEITMKAIYEVGKDPTTIRANIVVTNDEKVPTVDRKESNVTASNVEDVILEGMKLNLNGNNIIKDTGVVISKVTVIVGTTKSELVDPTTVSVSSGDTVVVQKLVVERPIGTGSKKVSQTIDTGMSFKVK